jgi:hypothetical protein
MGGEAMIDFAFAFFLSFVYYIALSVISLRAEDTVKPGCVQP